MRLKFTMMALAALLAAPTLVPDVAFARHHHYRGHTAYNNARCGRSGNGAVGTIGGGVGGALLGHAVGGGTLGTVAGGVGGALLGRHLDKQNTRNRHRC